MIREAIGFELVMSLGWDCRGDEKRSWLLWLTKRVRSGTIIYLLSFHLSLSLSANSSGLSPQREVHEGSNYLPDLATEVVSLALETE